ncbi:MAG: hypothetical protein KF746_15040 [Chitinophagaceae bacterium]|nr:hypothetical protein [Chitinophagaceae bacterium]
MKTKLLLRIAAGLIAFHLIGHSFGHGAWRQAAEPAKQEVIRQMTENKFPFMGAVHSMGDYYEGYGWACSITFIFFMLILWFVSGSLAENKSLIQKILTTLAVCLFVWSIDEFLFFFPFAGCITLLAAVLTFIAAIRLRNQKQKHEID